MRSALPAALGGSPAFASQLPLSRPSIPTDLDLLEAFRRVVESGFITKGSQLASFESELSDYLEIEHVVAVSSCTSGLMLLLRCLDLRGDVVLPSFTFMASGHVVRWNGLRPVFADIDPETFNMSPEDTAAAVGDSCAAIMAVHIFGTPCASDDLAAVADRCGVPLIVDAAPAFGAQYPDGTKVGTKGLAEVFSLSPTKSLTAGEGGLITTADGGLAKLLRDAREYGNPGDFNSTIIGMNARMPELSATLGLHSLRRFPEWLGCRQELAARYRANLIGIDGIGVQEIPAGASSTFKDLCITVRTEKYGLSRGELASALALEGVASRAYFDPPVHQQSAYREVGSLRRLPHTDAVSDVVLTLPLYTQMAPSDVDRVCEAVHRIGTFAEEIRASRSIDQPD